MAITQEQFDADLAALVGAIDGLIAAVDAAISAKPAADLTAEDQAVIDASKKVSDEVAKLAPPAPTN